MNARSLRSQSFRNTEPRGASLSFAAPRGVFWRVLSLIAICSALYVYFIVAAVMHTVERTNAEREMKQVSERVYRLEADIVLLESSIERRELGALGFTELTDIAHVSRSPAFSLRGG